MTKSELRKIIREIISQEVPRSAEAASYGSCFPKKPKYASPTYTSTMFYASSGRLPNPCRKNKCKYDGDCDEDCWCNHPKR